MIDQASIPYVHVRGHSEDLQWLDSLRLDLARFKCLLDNAFWHQQKCCKHIGKEFIGIIVLRSAVIYTFINTGTMIEFIVANLMGTGVSPSASRTFRSKDNNRLRSRGIDPLKRRKRHESDFAATSFRYRYRIDRSPLPDFASSPDNLCLGCGFQYEIPASRKIHQLSSLAS